MLNFPGWMSEDLMLGSPPWAPTISRNLANACTGIEDLLGAFEAARDAAHLQYYAGEHQRLLHHGMGAWRAFQHRDRLPSLQCRSDRPAHRLPAIGYGALHLDAQLVAQIDEVLGERLGLLHGAAPSSPLPWGCPPAGSPPPPPSSSTSRSPSSWACGSMPSGCSTRMMTSSAGARLSDAAPGHVCLPRSR